MYHVRINSRYSYCIDRILKTDSIKLCKKMNLSFGFFPKLLNALHVSHSIFIRMGLRRRFPGFRRIWTTMARVLRSLTSASAAIVQRQLRYQLLRIRIFCASSAMFMLIYRMFGQNEIPVHYFVQAFQVNREIYVVFPLSIHRNIQNLKCDNQSNECHTAWHKQKHQQWKLYKMLLFFIFKREFF